MKLISTVLNHLCKLLAASVCTLLLISSPAAADPRQEYLSRGTVAFPSGEGGMFVSWRALERDGKSPTYNIYRDGAKLTATPITDRTNYRDPEGQPGALYTVVTTDAAGSEVDTDSCRAWLTPYLKLHLDRPEGGTVTGMHPGTTQAYTYSPNDMSIGDVDGDGVWELFVKWEPSNAHDSAHSGFTGPTIFDCYRLDGTRLWRINLGQNIRSGAHYTQFLVADFDGDGRAEMICKTAPGTVDGMGHHVLLGDDKADEDHRVYTQEKAYGHVRGGSEYLTVFSGLTGEALHTIPYRPAYYDVSEEIWGDEKCNRSDRYLAGIASVDGQLPAAIMCRGYYSGSFVWAVNFRDGQLKEAWLHKSDRPMEGLWGEGAHSLVCGDVDGDGKDEIIFGASALDHDGSLLYRTGGGHGDALHLGKFISNRQGLQVFMPHEEEQPPYPYNVSLRDAATGEILYSKPQTGADVGRGIIADISDKWPGDEYWASDARKVYSCGKPVSSLRLPMNFRIYWDGDLLDELLDGTRVTKPDAELKNLATIADFRRHGQRIRACNGSKNTPCLQADLLGDWREEVILRDSETNSDIYIFSTDIPSPHRLPCLMEDRVYRLAIASQQTCYNQPPHLSYSPLEVYGPQCEPNVKYTSIHTPDRDYGSDFPRRNPQFRRRGDRRGSR